MTVCCQEAAYYTVIKKKKDCGMLVSFERFNWQKQTEGFLALAKPLLRPVGPESDKYVKACLSREQLQSRKNVKYSPW